MNIFLVTIKTWLIILSSLLAGLLFTFLPMPHWLYWFRPPWLVLILVYWVVMKPKYVNLVFAWVSGIFLDIIYNVTIGEHALVLVLVVYFVTKFSDKIIPLNFWKMLPIIFGLLIFYQSGLFIMQVYLKSYFDVWSIFSGAMIGALLWPLVAFLLSNYQQKFRI